MILHLALADDWQHARGTGEYLISTLGRTLQQEGYIHCCATDTQLHGVAHRYYSDVREPLIVLEIDPTGLDIRLETPPGATEAFPHLYGPLPITAVTATRPYR
ncbi:DUF952 domain-containing protein [Nonomuraea sp. NPDC046570]|uniref:DUF952 domain-containing protein n=1 Tax=Nonomuraea sp. NPDC046570 TaxID=3155255 RepID=UPI0033E87EB1